MKLASIALALSLTACVVPPATTTTSTTPYAAAPAPAPGAPAPAPAAAEDDGSGPPPLRRFIPGLEAEASAPYHRGDYLVALDYREEGYGTYGFLYHGDNHWWVVEQDAVVGGPIVDGGPEMNEVVARWRAGEQARHDAAMRGIQQLPQGCLDGCAFDVYENGRYSTRVYY